MSKKTKNNEGPACACGRVDIYKEMLKAKKANKDKDTDSTIPFQDGEDKNSVDEAEAEEDQK